MKEYSVTTAEKIRRIDPVILFCVLGMNIMSLITLASAADSLGTWYLKIQSIVSAFGFGLMIVIAFIDYDALITKLKYALPILSLGMIILVKLYGSGSLGNLNWITIPGTNISIQPTEFVKITFIVSFALHLAWVRDKINHPLYILGLAAHGGIMLVLVLWTGDLGMTLIYFAIIAFMLFGAGVSMWYFAGVGAAGLIASPIIWSHLSTMQQNRILFGFNPDLDPLDKGWNAIASRNCIISGGFRGAGFSGGTRYKSLFAAQSDFCYAVLAEKFGFIGAIAYLVLMTVLILRILWIARNTRKRYASFLCVGIAGMLIAQTLENVGMCLALLPVVGITLPFLSYGASSLMSAYICIGIVQSICAHSKKYYFERENE